MVQRVLLLVWQLKILPHNLRESVDACVALIDNPDLTNYDLQKVKNS